ncbi:MAG: cytochrome c2 [Cocleimonas sp.]|jgi:cytochrome c2
MKTLFQIPLLLLSCITFSNVKAENSSDGSGQQLFKKHCAVCHVATPGQRRIAPPIFAVKNHYLAVHDEELTFVDAVTSWVANPLEENSLMKGAISHFKLMPKIVVPEEEAMKIAEYIFSDAVGIPDAYKKHYADNHVGKPAKQYSRLLLRQLRLSPEQVDELTLSDDQLKRINQLIVEKEVIMQPMREEVLNFNQQLQSLDSRKSDYKSEIDALADVNAKRVEQMVLVSGEARGRIEAVLDEKQYQMLLKFRVVLLKRLKRS